MFKEETGDRVKGQKGITSGNPKLVSSASGTQQTN